MSLAIAVFYVWVTPDDGHHAKNRVSRPAVPLTPRLMVVMFGLFIVIALCSGTTFNLLTIALPKIVDERLAQNVPLLLAGSVATLVLICGGAGAALRRAAGRALHRAQHVRRHHRDGFSRKLCGRLTPTAFR